MDRIREYVAGLVRRRYGIIAVIQAEFWLARPDGYAAFGDTCGRRFHDRPDSVVVLFDKALFSPISSIGTTTIGGYSSMPYASSHGGTLGSRAACIGDPLMDGDRAYAGAILRHRSGTEVCVIVGTFPHRKPSPPRAAPSSLQGKFITDVREGCSGRPILFVVDSNVW